MKKIFAVLMVLILCVALAGCGNDNEKIKEELRGTWGYDFYASYVDQNCHQNYKFGPDSVESSWIVDEAPNKNSYHEGTYEIKDKEIIITYTDGTSTTLEYSYNNGNLRLFEKGSDGSVEEELKRK